ncbi:ankyrin repeat domain-containing protein, partial [archaeon]
MSGGAEVDASQVVQFVLDGNFEGVKTLIEAYGVDVDSTDDDGTTPLMAAAFAGNQKIFSYLLLQGAHVNAVQHAFNWTPLHCACSVEGGAPRMVTDLLQHGAYVNPVDCEGATPLDRLVETGVLTLVPTLRRAGGLTGAELQSSAAVGAAAAARGSAGKSTTTSGGYAAPHSTPVRQPAAGGAPPTPGSSLRERIMMSPGFGKARKTVVSQATAATAPPPSNIPPPSASRRTSRRSTTRAATTTSNTSPVYADPST